MATQKQIILRLVDAAGGQSKLAKLINKPASRVSEWVNENHNVSLKIVLEMCEKLNIKSINLKNQDNEK